GGVLSRAEVRRSPLRAGRGGAEGLNGSGQKQRVQKPAHVVGERRLEAQQLSADRVRQRELARVQRLAPEPQAVALLRRDQVVEHSGRSRRSAALREPEEDLLRRSVELVAHQREAGGEKMGA